MVGHVDDVKILTALLNAEPGLKLAFLYGSRADGRAASTSDFDVAVAFDGPLDPDARVDLAERLGAALHREVDLVDLHTARGLIAQEAIGRGSLLLKKDPLLLARLVKRMWFDKADYGPIRDRALESRRRRVFKHG